jgi:hypothetical protein
MADVEFVIGAKDVASQVLGRVDSSVDKLERSTKKLESSSQGAYVNIGASIGTLAKATGVIYAASLAIDALVGAFRSIGGAMDDFDRATESVRAMDQAMELNGGSSEKLVEQYSTLADTIERKTNIEAESVMEMMKSAAALGVQNDQLDEVTMTAIGLSETLGVSLEDGLKKARLAAEGNFASFKKLIPSIDELATHDEKLAAVSELAAKGLAMKEAASHSAAGEMDRMNNALGNLGEVFGAVLSPIRELAARGITLLADAMTNILGPAVEDTQALFDAWEPVILSTIESIVNGIIGGLTMAQVIYENFGDVVDFVLSSIALRYETYRADTEHLFVTTLPTYVMWFADNFYEIIETAYSAVYTVVYNHVTKIIDAMAALWEFIASGGTSDVLGQLGEIAGRSYLEGFESSIAELPNIAARAMTSKEQELTSSMGAIGNKLASEYAKKIEGRLVSFAKNTEKEGELAFGFGGPGGEGLGEDDKKKGKGVSNAALQAVGGRLLARGPVEKQEDLLKRIAEAVGATAKNTAQIAGTNSELTEYERNKQNAPTFSLEEV